MDPENEITLRLRFNLEIQENSASLLSKFEKYSNIKSENFTIKTSDNHIWLDIVPSKRKYWTPHLHLELEPKSDSETHIRGLFGPDPTLWTFFMFLHFIIAALFFVFGAMAYSDYILKNSLTLDVSIMVLMTVFWFSLYYLAMTIRKKGSQQMKELDTYFNTIINSANNEN
ncbi:hypothetical protein [Flavobacterium degerlachei]|jgi:hypothetical protein|uniref:GTP-binding protein n=1 Tax=Flavobacterium degerlachei TaxID=229203 RepID=A0A1H2WM57_9FLAO|nr:hypothetical protein [Flavobacterium degerlachei]SDW81743.1 hypothetical protein SAMN05444338_1055 [Flavobacterium degerlachei]